MKLKLFFAAFLLFCSVPTQAGAEQPAEKLDRYLSRVLAVVQSYDTEQSGAAERARFLERLNGMAEEIFDFRIMARMCLARQWQALTEKQQEEYVVLFTGLLQANYFGKVLKYLDQIKRFSKTNISIIDEIVYSAHRAEVRTVINVKEASLPVDYRFVSRDGPWRIYDICLENISLIQNYRSQFEGVLQQRSAEEFLGMLRKKVEQGRLLSKSDTSRTD